jgi:ABC-2 type transport system permease protein
MILIGRRHWSGGADGETMGRHFLVRGAAVVVAGVSLSILAGRFLGSSRMDITVERLNSVSPQTVQLLKNLPGDRPINVRAYVSPDAPESYVKTRQDLIRVLAEAQALSGGRVVATGSHAELLASCPLYARLHSMQFREEPGQGAPAGCELETA